MRPKKVPDVVMRTKSVRNYVDRGWGFPVVFDSVRLAHVRGEWVPLVDYARCEDAVLEALCRKPAALTGSEVRFVRLHFKLTLAEFGKALGVTHVAVRKWEKKADATTGMTWAIEKTIRLYVFRRINAHAKPFVQLFDALGQRVPSDAKPIRLPGAVIARLAFAQAG